MFYSNRQDQPGVWWSVLQKVKLKCGCCFVYGLDLRLDGSHTYGHVDFPEHLGTPACIHQRNVLRCGDDHSTWPKGNKARPSLNAWGKACIQQDLITCSESATLPGQRSQVWQKKIKRATFPIPALDSWLLKSVNWAASTARALQPLPIQACISETETCTRPVFLGAPRRTRMAHKVLCAVTEHAREAVESRQRDKKEHHQDKDAVSLCVGWRSGRQGEQWGRYPERRTS